VHNNSSSLLHYRFVLGCLIFGLLFVCPIVGVAEASRYRLCGENTCRNSRLRCFRTCLHVHFLAQMSPFESVRFLPVLFVCVPSALDFECLFDSFFAVSKCQIVLPATHRRHQISLARPRRPCNEWTSRESTHATHVTNT
jgi:hypothetical protein